jgi:ADP-ribosylglycohydrolase
MLFFHDDALKQQQALIQATQPWSAESSTQASLLALGYAIAQACKQQLNPTTLLSEISAYLQLCVAPDRDQTTHTLSWLAITQTLLAETSDLHTAMTTVQQWQRQPNLAGAIALAFYCFLRTPEAWPLSVQMAGRPGYSPSLVAAFTGALSGAYNSEIAIPISWLTAYEQNQAATAEPTITATAIRQQATQLLASWSGSYHVATVHPLTAAVAAPQVIRPR